MKNLKKVLALVTVVAMLITCAPVVFAGQYSDVADNASYAEAVEMLSALGIFTGYEDGTFQPDKTITRAEAAAVITRFLNQEATAQAMKGQTIFTDMADAEWATGYVNYGVQQGYINGMGDNTFHPSDPVTYEQIVKMIVAALGYTIKAEDQGGYPSGYLSVASQLEITKGTSGSNGAASRATVAKLLYQALDVNQMVVSKYTKDGDKEYSEDGKTVLEDKHKVDKYVGVVTSSYLINLDKADTDKTVDIHYTEKNGDTDDEGDVTAMVGETKAAEFLGYQVTAYVQEDEDTGDDTIIAISAKGNKNSVLTVPAANLDDPAYDGAKTVKYWKNKDSDRKATEIDLNTNPTVITNNEDGAADDLNDDLTGVVTFISNDGNTNNGYEFVIISAYSNQFVIDEIDAENFIITAVDDCDITTTGSYELDPEDEDTLYTIFKDGKPATFEDLEEGDTVSVIGDDTPNVVFYVSSTQVTGTVTAFKASSDEYTIDGSLYKLADGVGALSVSDEGTYYVNVDGLIIYADASADAEGNYGYFIAYDEKESFGKSTWTIEFVDENGNDVKAQIATRVKIGVGATSGSSVKSEELTDRDLAVLDGLFKYDTNSSGEITKIITAKARKTDKEFSVAKEFALDEATYKEATNSVGTGSSKVAFDDATVVFNVTADPVADADDVSVSTISALFTDGESTNRFIAYDADSDKVVGAVVVFGAANKIDEESNVVVVTGLSSTKFGDENGYVIEGLQGGKAVSFNVCDDEEECKNYDDVKTLEKGDVIMVAEGAKYLTNVVVKVKVEDIDLNDVAYASTNYKTNPVRVAEDIMGLAKDKDNGEITFAKPFHGTEDTAYVRGANFTYVSLDNTNSIKTASLGTVNTGSSKYGYYLYVRTADGDAVDVVIYEFSKN